MIKTCELDEQLKKIDEMNDLNSYEIFKESLLSSNKREVLEYHYELFLKNIGEELKGIIVYSFADRKGYGEEFLLEKLNNEKNIFFQAISIELLGIMKYKKALSTIRALLKHKNQFVRQRVCLSLGYMGSSKDMKSLGDIQLYDNDIVTRELSAITQMKISKRYKRAKDKLLENFFNALNIERISSVILSIGYATQNLLDKDFCIVEVNEGEFNYSKDIELLRKELKQVIKEALKR